MEKFQTLPYAKQYGLIVGLLDKWKHINTSYAGVYHLLLTSGYISESFLGRIYHHALALAHRDILEQQEKKMKQMIKHKQTIVKREQQEMYDEEVEDLLFDV